MCLKNAIAWLKVLPQNDINNIFLASKVAKILCDKSIKVILLVYMQSMITVNDLSLRNRNSL